MTTVAERIPDDSDPIDTRLAPHRRQLIGAALVVLSTVAIAIVPTFAKLAYDGGSDTLTVIAGRSVATAAICFMVTVILGRPLAIPRRALALSLGLGALYAAHLYGLLGAVTYLPVNMVILIFFTHPLIIGVAAMSVGHKSASLLGLGALIGAAIGLGLAVGFSVDNLSVVGVALAALAALMAAAVITCSALAMRDSDSLAVTSYMMLSAAVCLVILSLLQNDLRLPVTAGGWLGFGGVAVSHTIGTLTFFVAIPLLGAVRAAMITNLEPVLGIVFAMLILGERMSPVQAAGIAMVIASISPRRWRARQRGDGGAYPPTPATRPGRRKRCRRPPSGRRIAFPRSRRLSTVELPCNPAASPGLYLTGSSSTGSEVSA